MNDDIRSIGTPDDDANLNSRLMFMAEEDGTYYIAASSYNRIPGSDNSGTYSISVEALDLPADIEGTDANEKLTGTDGAESIAGGAGDDTINGMGGDDELDGGADNDLITGGPGADMIKGGAGMDTIAYGYSPMGVSINLRSGTASGGDADTLTGGEDDDTASYAGSMMGVTVRLHSSTAMGGDAKGDVWGDTVTVDYMLPDEDGELQDFTETVPDIVNLTGSGNADILAGDSRDNTIKGGGGDDKLYGGPGGGDDTLRGDGGADMVFGGHGDDTLHGGAGDDMLNGGPGIDEYYGAAGSDMIYAGNEDTVIDGWFHDDDAPEDDDDVDNGLESTEAVSDPKAVDTVSYARLKAGVEKTLGAGGITNIENIIGTDEDDILTGEVGVPNVINGLDGADDLDGGTGTDPGDTVSYENSDRGVTVTVNADGPGSASGGHAQGDTIDNFENATGSAHDDNLNGDEGVNTLKGLAGDDELIGGTGADTIEGGAGADEMDGGTSTASAAAANLSTYDADGGVDQAGDHGADSDGDTLSYAGSDAAVVVNLATVTVSGGHAEGDEIEVERDAYDPDGNEDGDPIDVATFEHITGSMHNDRLTGDHRANTIMGGDGDDTVSGGGAMDVLMGGKGDDTISGGAVGDHLIGGPGADRLDGGEERGERDNMKPNPEYDPDADDGDDGVDDMRMIDLVAADYDWAVYRPAEAGVEVDLSNNRGTGGDAMGDRLVGIELVWGSTHDDTFIASADEDTSDIIHGDSGSDTVSYEASEIGVTVNLDTDNDDAGVTPGGDATMGYTFDYVPTAVVNGMPSPSVADIDDEGVEAGNAATNGAFGDRLGGIQNLTGSNQVDSLTGDDTHNVLKGLGGNDTLVGGEGNDTLMGGDGHDRTMQGGLGNDRLVGGAGNDQMSGDGGTDTFVFGPGHGDSR